MLWWFLASPDIKNETLVISDKSDEMFIVFNVLNLTANITKLESDASLLVTRVTSV